MGFSMKIFPGVRIGVTKRGMNASIGPRIARMHAGPGGVRYSSGLGPVSVSGGSGRRSRRASGGLDFEAFDAAMRISPEQKTMRLEKEIKRLEGKGWKLDSREEFSAVMSRKSSQKRKITWVVIFGLMFWLTLDEISGQLTGRKPINAESPLYASVIGALIFGGALLYQILTIQGAKGAKRKFEIGDYGVLHKHYHG